MTKAAGQGSAHIYNPATQQTDEILFVYTARTVSGTIILLEHHARTHPRIHRWTQEATPSDDRGRITLLAEDGTIVSSYETIRAGGLYNIQDLNFIPAGSGGTDVVHVSSVAHIVISINNDTMTVSVHTVQVLEETYHTPALEIEHTAYLLGYQVTPSTTTCVAQSGRQGVKKAAKEILLLQYELWRQWLGHVPAHRLQQTAPYVQGLPSVHASHIPSFVRCRACDVGKLKKASRGHPLLDSPTLQPGQCFHMDIGFLQGPSNLAAILDRQEEPQSKVIHSRHNFVCYLLVVDRKSRYMWAFPLRSRAVPTYLMRTLLAVHGHDTARHAQCVRTGKDPSPNLFISVRCWEWTLLPGNALPWRRPLSTGSCPHSPIGRHDGDFGSG